MQTFLPYPEFERSAAALDPVRLGKQRVETLQILRALAFTDYGWQRHPAVLMWQGRVPALVAYGLACVDAWTALGRADSTAPLISEFAPSVVGCAQPELAEAGLLPEWLGDPELHLSHRAALVRKDPEYYRPLFGELPDVPYVWPAPDPPAEPVSAGLASAEPLSAEPLPAEPLPAEPGLRAWVVRCPPGATVWLPLAPPSGRASPKHQRQVTAFRDTMQPGDLVAAPVAGDARLALGVLTGPPVEESGRLQRTVAWAGIEVDRAELAVPALLQDPRLLFRVEFALGDHLADLAQLLGAID